MYWIQFDCMHFERVSVSEWPLMCVVYVSICTRAFSPHCCSFDHFTSVFSSLSLFCSFASYYILRILLIMCLSGSIVERMARMCVDRCVCVCG